MRDYAEKIKLFTEWNRPEVFSNHQDLLEAMDVVLGWFLAERGETVTLPQKGDEKSRLLQGLMNVRPPAPVEAETGRLLDRILWTERVTAGVVKVDEIPDLWRGDITRLDADAIVNAANSELLGCFHPLHNCIDNAIHSAAGPEMRNDCQEIRHITGKTEGTGLVKITRAYNLPSKYVLHTVGPIVQGVLTEDHRKQLVSSYRECLEVAAQKEDIKSVVFCCISTGVFGYPKEEAARTATLTVREWAKNHPGRFDRVIFNVFTEEDNEIYKRYL